MNKKLIALAIASMLAGSLLACVKPVYAAPRHNEKYVKTLVSDQLRDPSSARFKGIRIKGPKDSCGFVSGKNVLGGYTDFTMFMVTEDSVSFIEEKLTKLMDKQKALIESSIARRNSSVPESVEYNKAQETIDTITKSFGEMAMLLATTQNDCINGGK